MALVLFENSYIADASAYLADNPAWESASEEEQEQALVDATRILDQTQWVGSAVSPTQPLAWPRSAFTYFDPVMNHYIEIEEGEVPTRLAKATAYLALHLIRYPQVVQGYEASFDEITVGPISVKNTDAQSSPGRIPTVPAEVNRLLEPLVWRGAVVSGSAWWRSN